MAHDDNYNKDNIDKAIFATPSFTIASAYAFKDKIKENSGNLNWNFVISSKEEYPIMTMKNVNTNDDIYGYIYVFRNDGNFQNDPEGTLQYKYFKSLIPIDIVIVKYKDFKKYYLVQNN